MVIGITGGGPAGGAGCTPGRVGHCGGNEEEDGGIPAIEGNWVAAAAGN